MQTTFVTAAGHIFSETNDLPQCLIPVVMSGIIAVYSLVISVLIAQDLAPPSIQSYSLFRYDTEIQPPRGGRKGEHKLTDIADSCTWHAAYRLA